MEGSDPSIATPLEQSGQVSHADILRRMIVSRPADAPDDLAFTPDFAPEPQADLSIDRVAAVALGRTADRLYGLPTFVESVANAPATPAELAELFPERALLAVVQGDGDRLGVVALCPSLIASLIEMQAIGRVSSRAVRARKPTRTDASITADFVNRLLCELGNAAAAGPDCPDFAHYRYASFLDDARPLLLMLDDAPLANLTLTFRIGNGGQRDGKIIVALPTGSGAELSGFNGTMPALTMQTPEPDFDTHEPFAQATDSFLLPEAGYGDPDSLAPAVQQAPIPLRGVLCRRPMTLRAIRALKAGDLIPLPAGALNETRLETESGQILALGRLGEADGLHAIRLHDPDHHAGGAEGGIAHRAASTFAGQVGGFDDHADSLLPQIDTAEPDHFRDPPQEFGESAAMADAFARDGANDALPFDPDFGATPAPDFAADFGGGTEDAQADTAENALAFDLDTLPSFG